MTYELRRDPRSSQQRIARYVRSLGAEPILDVGASVGHLGRLVSGSGLTIDAVENDPASAEVAKTFYREVFVASIEQAPLATRHYRVVVCADVLEHTVDPTSVLRRLQEAATADARFIVSLPNVAHIAGRALLMLGRFPQHESGIFDRTHLHFYTRDTATKLIEGSGLRVRGVSTTPVPLEAAMPGFVPAAVQELAMGAQVQAARIAPRLFGYQWLIVATRA